MTNKNFKYYPEDFKVLSVNVKNMTLFFDVYDNYTNVESKITCISREDLSELELNADNLEIHEVKCNHEMSFEYQKDKKIIMIKFEKEVSKDSEIVIETKTTCKPTKNILEGLYYDETPEGCPPQMITQCQQWGFQRVVPCFDDMSAKCTYNTTIVADSKYTHIITNGDIVTPKTDIGNGRSKIVYDNTTTPMATYLFFLGVGTWDEYKRTFEYPNGSKFDVELLVLKGLNLM